MNSLVVGFAIVALGAVLAIAGAAAQDAPGPSARLTGDWGGLRTELENDGLGFTGRFVSDSAFNMTGGTKQGFRQADEISLGATLDLQRLLGLDDAQFQLSVTDRNGRSLVSDEAIGALQQVQEVYGHGDIWRLSDLWYRQTYFDRLDWKIGRMPVGEDFATFACDFENQSFCRAQPGNIVDYWYNEPVAQWATRARWLLPDFGYVQAGAYQVNQRNLDTSQAFAIDYPSGTDGALVPLEAAWLPKFGAQNLMGSYKVGVWYNSAREPDAVEDANQLPALLTGRPFLLKRGAYGGYVELSQQILHRDGAEPGQGLSLFLNVSAADRRTATEDSQAAVGLVYTGPFESRPCDAIGLAVARSHVNSRVASAEALANAAGNPVSPVQGAEYATELYYSFDVVPGLAVRPNLQYIADPGGASVNRNAVVGGIKLVATF
jgi:porin